MNLTDMEPLSFLNRRLSSAFETNTKDSRSVYLKFYIDPVTPALLSMKNIQEAAVLSSNLLTSMPNMPSYILGLTNRRSRVMWVVDVSQMLGLPHISFIPPKLDIVVAKIGAFISALAVHKIDGILRIDPDAVNSAPSHLSSALIPYLEGCFLQEKTIFLVLDSEAIAQSPLLHQI